MTPKFKPGDLVRRVQRPFLHLRIGDEVTIVSCSRNNLFIKDFPFGFDPMYFELVTPKAETTEYNESEWE